MAWEDSLSGPAEPERPWAQLPPSPTGEAAKTLGAYYTDAAVARFLVRWALRKPHDTLADPAFGGGVFLAAASERLQQLGGSPEAQVFGVELDPATYQQSVRVLATHFAIRKEHLFQGDFFHFQPPVRLSCVVGNPPFIRYQRLDKAVRERALALAQQQGVQLDRRASVWAAFVVQAAAWLEPGGRLALVVPLELAHAAYARPVLEYLARAFREVTLIACRERLFPNLSQEVLLLLAEGRRASGCTGAARPDRGSSPGEEPAVFWLQELAHTTELETFWPTPGCTGAARPDRGSFPKAQALDLKALVSGQARLAAYWLSPVAPGTVRLARELYRSLAAASWRLGQVARVDIGYVTGHNAFFHLSPAQAQRWAIPEAFLRPAVWRAGALRGLWLTQTDWQEACMASLAGYLLCIPKEAEPPPTLARYLREGEAQGVPLAYKCRKRRPWYALSPKAPEAFLTYMNHQAPRLVANPLGAVAPNSLHGVYLQPSATARLSPKALAALFQTSLTQLSAEIEGRALGGGMLKLEPSEAERLVLPKVNMGQADLEALAKVLDHLLRQGRVQEAQSLADTHLLQEHLGLSAKEVKSLAEAARYLRARRQKS
ncbi:HsdM family class I SAM-dependent methyltransferase [Meiothermus rufus]|uniref:HsdM family class I SAM-dependent methyltransferase n=1 Tax=Meiothermus rufus TaxID=604332 RepID=UPI00040B220F|nr:N-6 DNA methylase [Meiothermus rufus]